MFIIIACALELLNIYYISAQILFFQAPVPVESWRGIRDAIKDGNECIQGSYINHNVTGSEDCLHLSVFTTTVSIRRIFLVHLMS